MLLPWHEHGDDGDGNDSDNNKMTMKTHSNTQLGCAYGATPSDFYYALNSVGSWPVNSFAIIIIIINKSLGIFFHALTITMLILVIILIITVS